MEEIFWLLVRAAAMGLLTALITYGILWVINFAVAIDELSRRRVSAVVGVIIALLVVLKVIV